MKKILVSPNFKDLLTPNINIGCFPDGDSHVFIPNLVKLRGQKVFLCHRLYPNQNNSLVELILILGLLKKEKIRPVLIVPYLPYARQDKYFLEGEAASAQEICKLFHTLGCQKLITFDCHFLKKPGKFVFENLPIENISLGDELIHYAQKINPRQKLEIIAPDEGASYLVKKQGGKTCLLYTS
nr:ribose-phosphate pyrophosphokinase-like domain-containing protein [Candidatus Shapirobacteria bacterium]